MALSTKELWMDFHNQNITRLCVVQNEKDTRKYNVHFCDDGIPIQLNATDYELYIAEKKADGNKVLKACTINSDGTGLLVFDENMCISNGSASLQFILRNKKDNSWTRTIAFNARIHEAVLNNGDITSSTEFDVLSSLIVKVEELDKLVTDNEKIRQANEETRKINETKRINAENTRKQNETARTNAESERVKNENTRIANEKTRQTQETKRQNDTATAITNANNAAKNANDKANDLQNKLDNHHFVLTNELENSVSSTSTTHAPTANAVKTVYDKAVSVENTINSNKNNWNDKYTKNEIDNKFSTLENNIDWKESVATFSDIAKTYPNPEDGWTVNVKDTDYTYRYSGDKWVAISANAIPKATQSVDGLLTKEDKTSYDDANSKKHTHSNKSVLDSITSALVNTWNKVTDKLDKTGDASNTTNTITTATARTNLTTGEKLSVSLGKISKYFSDLKTVAFTGSYNDLTNKPTSMTANGGNSTTVNGHTVNADVPSGAKFTDTVYTHPIGDGNKHIPANGTTNNGKYLKATGTAGSYQWGNITKNDVVNALGYTPGTSSTEPLTYSLSKSGSKITLTSSTGNVTSVTDSDTTYSNMKGATTSATGTSGLVPAPSTGAANRYLRSDGTWAVPPDNNTTYNNFVKSGSGAKSGLVPAPSTTAGTTKYLREDGTWQIPPNTNTTYSAGTGIGLSNTTFYNTGVRSIATGSTNGSVAVNTNGTVADVKVKGLNTLAYASGTWNKLTGTNCTLWYNEVAVYLEISAQNVNLKEYGGTATNKTIVVLPTNVIPTKGAFLGAISALNSAWVPLNKTVVCDLTYNSRNLILRPAEALSNVTLNLTAMFPRSLFTIN